MSFDIRPMSLADLERALGWAAEEGWNPGLDDATPFHAQDPGGFLMGWLDGEPVGCISVVKYGAEFAFLGLYIVRPEYRGRGYGKALWDAGIASAGQRTIGLDGVPAQQDNYRRSGFAYAHGSARWIGMLPVVAGAPAGVVDLGPADFATVEAYDRRQVAAPRENFLRAWLQPSANRRTVGLVEDGRLAGYGSIRRCVVGWKIGPLFADRPEVAESLIAVLGRHVGGEQVAIDVPEPNQAATAMAARLGHSPSFATARMYLGPAPALPLERVFGITTLELG